MTLEELQKRLKKYTILYAEDDEGIREVYLRALSKMGGKRL
ncbi:hypothetical protein [Limisalsivibrio acetivorans]|nr:hypothetical protein [Limisalsivibrio acetivorans]